MRTSAPVLAMAETPPIGILFDFPGVPDLRPGETSEAGPPIPSGRLTAPVARPVVVPVESLLELPADRNGSIPFRSVLDRRPVQIDRHGRLGPVDAADPSRGHQHLLARPPCAGLHDEIPDRPRFVIHDEV